THGDDRIRIAGTHGVIEVINGRLLLIDANGSRELQVLPPERELFSDYVTELLTSRHALVDDADTLKLARAVLLARESADTCKTIYF
ncbi:MAG: gfo/Idh/MocA family oxidoreductase, partial [Lentisphaeria bacterium]